MPAAADRARHLAQAISEFLNAVAFMATGSALQPEQIAHFRKLSEEVRTFAERRPAAASSDDLLAYIAPHLPDLIAVLEPTGDATSARAVAVRIMAAMPGFPPVRPAR